MVVPFVSTGTIGMVFLSVDQARYGTDALMEPSNVTLTWIPPVYFLMSLDNIMVVGMVLVDWRF